MLRVVEFLKSHKKIMDFVAFIYNLSHGNRGYLRYLLKYGGDSIQGVFMKRVVLDLSGKGVKLYIGRRTQMKNCRILLTGDDTSLYITGTGTNINDTSFVMAEIGSSIVIGERFTMEGGQIRSLEGAPIRIGHDCMFSSDIDIASGDYHIIMDKDSSRRINSSKEIMISDHVWLGAHVNVLKGTVIPQGCIIGNSSVVTSKLDKQNAIYAGVPARYIKGNIDWKRERNQ